jgi:hypothetical protein
MLIGILAAVLIVVLIATAYSILTVTVTFTSTGRINTTANIGIYSDSACTQPLSAIDWGNLTVGTTSNYLVYVKNMGNVRQTISLSANAWVPSTAAQYLDVTWDQNNTALNPAQVVTGNIKLAVATIVDTDITTFSNNITITGTGIT